MAWLMKTLNVLKMRWGSAVLELFIWIITLMMFETASKINIINENTVINPTIKV